MAGTKAAPPRVRRSSTKTVTAGKAPKVKVTMGGAAPGTAPRYEKKDGAQPRFWQVERRANVVTTWSGVVGKTARRAVRTLADDRRAKLDVEMLVEAKPRG